MQAGSHFPFLSEVFKVISTWEFGCGLVQPASVYFIFVIYMDHLHRGEWGWATQVVTSAFCLAGLAAVRHWGLGLPAVWAAIKVITFGRTAGAIARYANPKSTLGGFQVIRLHPIMPSPPAPVPPHVPALPVTASAKAD